NTLDATTIQQIEDALAALKAGDEAALARLRTLLGVETPGDTTTVGNITESIGIAIGQQIHQTIVVIQRSDLENSATLLAALQPLAERFSTAFDLPHVPEEDRPRRRGATPRVFISYAHTDTLAITPIVQRLSQKFYYDVWIDYDSIPLGENWRRSIAEGITHAEVVRFMASPGSLASAACRAEIAYALERDKPIIPVRLTTAFDWVSLRELGLDDPQGVDFSGGHADAVWQKLLDNLPEVLPRNRRWNDPGFQERHREYLRGLFTRYGQVNLTYLLDAAPRERVTLMDVYVPLKLDVSLNFEVRDGDYHDWGLYLHADRNERPPSDEERVAPVLSKVIRGFRPEGQAMEVFDQQLHEIWEREKDQVYKEDGIYVLKRIESETAPALQQHLVITGDPGSGKSPLLKHLALSMAGDMLAEVDDPDTAGASLEALGFWPHPAYTPIFVELKELVEQAFPPIENLSAEQARASINLDLFLDYIEAHLLSKRNTDYLDDLRAQLMDGDAMIFQDGLDEVPDADTTARREQIKALADLLRQHYPKCRIVVTSRPYAYAGDWSLAGFGQVGLAPLDRDRLEELALRLFRVVLGQEAAEEQARSFKRAMRAIPQALRRSPLFFTLLAAIWLNNQVKPPQERLPTSKGAIYRECVEMLIRRWTKKDLDGDGLSIRELLGLPDDNSLRTLLESIAYTVHSDESDLGRSDQRGAPFTAGAITDAIVELGYKHARERLVRDLLASRAGILYEEATNRFRFAHRSFQEHLAALSAAVHCYQAQRPVGAAQYITASRRSRPHRRIHRPAAGTAGKLRKGCCPLQRD
ncbi:MAG: TIR domain-containing protein, partial [Anaerolineae bacterium]